MREFVFYQTDFGEKPVEDFLAALEPAPRAKVSSQSRIVADAAVCSVEVLAEDARDEIFGNCERNTQGTFIGFWPAPIRATG